MSYSDIKIIPPKELKEEPCGVTNTDGAQSFTNIPLQPENYSFVVTDKQYAGGTIKKEKIQEEFNANDILNNKEIEVKEITSPSFIPKEDLDISEPLKEHIEKRENPEFKSISCQDSEIISNVNDMNAEQLEQFRLFDSETLVLDTTEMRSQSLSENLENYVINESKSVTVNKDLNNFFKVCEVTEMRHEVQQPKLDIVDLNNVDDTQTTVQISDMKELVDELNNEIILAQSALFNNLNTIQNSLLESDTHIVDNINRSFESSAGSEVLIKDIGRLNISETNNKSLSSVVVNRKTDSLRNLMAYDSSDSESDSDFEKDWQLHMLNNPDSINSSEDSDSNESLSSDASSIIEMQDVIVQPKKIASGKSNDRLAQSALYSLEELDKFNLPPFPDLNNLQIDYEHEEFLHIGHVKAIVETLVTIETIQGSPSYDLDTILFIEDQTCKKALGAIYDVIGPVVAPIYCIRMKNETDLQEKGVKLNMKVYSAPKSKYTQYVFVAELRKIKGTDASWRDDQELPPGVEDSSGEECEFDPSPLKRKRNSLEKHKKFEKTMNRCNSLHTKVANLMDHHRVARRGMARRQSPIITNVVRAPEALPIFNPTVPPPTLVDLSALPPPPSLGACTPPQQYPPQFGAMHYQRPPQMWQQINFQQPTRFHWQQHVPRQNQSQYSSHNWNHHPGPSRGHGFY